MDWTSPQFVLLGSLGSLGLSLAGLRYLISDYSQRAEVARRTRLQTNELGSGWLHDRLDARVRATEFGGWVHGRLAAAGVDLKVVDFMLLTGAIALGVLMVTNVFFPSWMAILAAVLAVRVSWAWVEHQRGKRRDRFISQLPDIARLLSNASGAGLAVRRAIEMAAEELDEPAASEMSMVAEELRFGQSMESALVHLDERMPSREVGVLITTLMIQQRSGGDLVHALGGLAGALDARRDMIREVKTVMSGSIFTSYMVAGIGVGMLALINVMSPGVFDKMMRSPWGLVAMTVSASLYVIGFVLIRRTTRIEV